MSYLLTEIALEMLGYKFYDIYGMQDEINNFQKHANSDRANNDTNSNESLAHLLGVNGTSLNTADRKINQVNIEVLEEVNANLPETLTKLMDTEYNKIRQQIIRSKPSELETHNAQNSIQSYIDNEHEKLRLECQNLRSFRKIVEKNLLQINPATFEKYCQTFKPARKQLKRLDTNKK